jgi:hypothetical protein
LNKHYKDIFPEKEFTPTEDLSQKEEYLSEGKILKIKYSLNILPTIGSKDMNFLRICADADEIELFNAVGVKELIEFKWNKLAFKFHLIGFLIHMVYMVVLLIYTQ